MALWAKTPQHNLVSSDIKLETSSFGGGREQESLSRAPTAVKMVLILTEEDHTISRWRDFRKTNQFRPVFPISFFSASTRRRCCASYSTLAMSPTRPRGGTCTGSGRRGALRSSSSRATARQSSGWSTRRSATGTTPWSRSPKSVSTATFPVCFQNELSVSLPSNGNFFRLSCRPLMKPPHLTLEDTKRAMHFLWRYSHRFCSTF